MTESGKPDEQSRKQAAPDAKTQVTGDDEATRIRDAAATQVSPATTQLLPPSEGPDPAGATEVVKVSTTVAVDADETLTDGGTVVSRVADSSAQSGDDAGDLEVGDVLKDRFVIDKIIGRGGMGVVYRARDLRKEETEDRDPYVAVKVLGEAFRRDPRMVMALQREARKAQTLAHPAIATVYDFDRDGERVYLTMEVLEGQPIDEVVAAHPEGMPPDKAAEIVRGMCLGLAYAHNKNIIHSDFKPGNVFLTADGRTKTLDFGIARAAPAGTFGSADLQKYSRSQPTQFDQGGDTVFDAGSLGALTPSYASCEMFEGEEPHPADDVYALALTHYELLTGKHPFGNAPAPAARDAGMTPEPIPGLPRKHWKAISRGLAFARADRSQHAAEYLSDLDGRTWLRPALAATVLLLIGTAGYLAWDQAEEIEIARPDVPFEELPIELQERFTEAISDGEMFLRFNDPASAFQKFQSAYLVHPRNPVAVEKLEGLMPAMLELAAAAEPRNRATLAENIRHLADEDDFLRQNAVLRDTLEDLAKLR